MREVAREEGPQRGMNRDEGEGKEWEEVEEDCRWERTEKKCVDKGRRESEAEKGNGGEVKEDEIGWTEGGKEGKKRWGRKKDKGGKE